MRAYLGRQRHVETYKAKSKDKKINNYRNLLACQGVLKETIGFMPYMLLFAGG